jgi:hypothetical protein
LGEKLSLTYVVGVFDVSEPSLNMSCAVVLLGSFCALLDSLKKLKLRHTSPTTAITEKN